MLALGGTEFDKVFYGGKGFSVVLGDSVGVDAFEMLPRWVSGVVFPAVMRVLLSEGAHQVIAVGFGDDGGGGDGDGFCVAFDDGLCVAGEGFGREVAVDEGEGGWVVHLFIGSGHGEEGGLDDVDGVGLDDGGFADAPMGVLLDEGC